MTDFKETSIGYINVDDYASFTSNERKWIGKILQPNQTYPDKVKIIFMPGNNHGYIVAQVPKRWMKLSPPRKVNLTDEQKKAAADRMRSIRNTQD